MTRATGEEALIQHQEGRQKEDLGQSQGAPSKAQVEAVATGQEETWGRGSCRRNPKKISSWESSVVARL